ncbi:MAG: orotate phosphoribosyltransferase [Gemmatimonadota bacterium]
MTDDRERLKALLIERSVRLGDFTLASGAHSDYYVDARRTTMSAEGQALVGRVALAALRGSGLEPTHVGGLTMGADPISYAIAHRSFLDGAPLDAFSVRKQAKKHGTGQRIEGGLPSDARCVMIEDAMTTGGSTLDAIDAVLEHGADVIGVLTLVDRSEDAAARFGARGLPLIALYTGEALLRAAKAAGQSRRGAPPGPGEKSPR